MKCRRCGLGHAQGETVLCGWLREVQAIALRRLARWAMKEARAYEKTGDQVVPTERLRWYGRAHGCRWIADRALRRAKALEKRANAR